MRPVSPYMAHTTVRCTGPDSAARRCRERAAAMASAATAGPWLAVMSVSVARPSARAEAASSTASFWSESVRSRTDISVFSMGPRMPEPRGRRGMTHSNFSDTDSNQGDSQSRMRASQVVTAASGTCSPAVWASSGWPGP